MTQPAVPKDPFTGFNFRISMDGLTRAAFQECTGLSSAIDLIEYREGGATHPSKLAGLTKYGNVVLRRGVTDDRELYDWHLAAVNGDISRRNGSIVVLDRKGGEAARWNFFGAWPQRWEGPALNSETSGIAVETLELAVERLERA
ncbi:phage tail protein [Streptomyces sp. NPDC004111]|uniref:phage tail protein n=1 Tax=Streptomyces sp. NPDC004111 TaxID=3364690 RepID=UPI00367EE9D2